MTVFLPWLLAWWWMLDRAFIAKLWAKRLTGCCANDQIRAWRTEWWMCVWACERQGGGGCLRSSPSARLLQHHLSARINRFSDTDPATRSIFKWIGLKKKKGAQTYSVIVSVTVDLTGSDVWIRCLWAQLLETALKIFYKNRDVIQLVKESSVSLPGATDQQLGTDWSLELKLRHTKPMWRETTVTLSAFLSQWFLCFN